MSDSLNFQKFYNGLIAVGESLQSVLLLGIRLYWGGSFFQGGLGKFNGIADVATYFESLGIPFPAFNAYTTASIEVIGGLLLLVGFGTRLAAIPLMIVMIVAYLTAHVDSVKHIFEDPNTFIQQAPFNYLLACLILFVFGPGKISIDYVLEKIYGKPQSRQGQ